ncbi:MAG: rRNA maturation RNase YbeY [Ilumatobacteraceae bacterium]
MSTKAKVGGDGRPDVFCADEQDALSVDLARWQALALNVLHDEGVRGLAELALLFVSAAEIAELNESYLGKVGPTDVLAFPIDAEDLELVTIGQPPNRGPDRAPPDDSDIPLLLGDVVVCPEIAAEQAASHAGTVDDELALLVVHGVLHVLGYDHAEADERELMRTRERALLEAHHWHGPVPAGFMQEQSTDPGET